MKITFNKKQLLDLTNTTIGFTSDKSTMPILGNILVSHKDGVLSLTASNLEIQAKATTTDTQLTEEFSFTISAACIAHSLQICELFCPIIINSTCDSGRPQKEQ